jgi:hypothetical protein
VEPASQAQVQGPQAVRRRDDAQDVQGHRAAAAAGGAPAARRAAGAGFRPVMRWMNRKII